MATPDGWTSLMLAAQHGHEKAVRALLDGGADARLRANDGATAKVIATHHGHQDVVRLLEEAIGDDHAVE